MDSYSPLTLFMFQSVVAALMFIVVNWLGKHSAMLGYESVTMFTESEASGAFNFLFRVVTPVVMLLVVAAACYSIGMGGLVKDLHFAVLLYLAFRVAFNYARGRAVLLPWARLIIQWICTIALTFVAYEQLMSKPENLLPDPATIANEIWLGIAAYLYILSGQVFSGDAAQAARGARYVQRRKEALESTFATELSSLGSARWRMLVLAVMIVEDFNRPAIARVLERLLFRLGFAKTLGIMQVATSTVISDAESVRVGTQLLQRAFLDAMATDDWRLPNGHWSGTQRQDLEESNLVHATLVRYNPSGDYARDVAAVYEQLVAAEPNAVGGSLHPDRR